MTMLVEGLAQSAMVSRAAEEVAARVQVSVVQVQGSPHGVGSGVVWRSPGLIVTNHHVAPGRRARVAWAGSRPVEARVVAHDEWNDLALLQVDDGAAGAELTPASVRDSTTLRVGELVLAVGNALGERNAVTLGVVSAVGSVRGRGGERELIQAAITVRPGNSGGALADAEGRVVGIPHVMVGLGSGLAIPSHVVERFLRRGQAGRPFFGLVGQWVRIPPAVKSRYGLPGQVGMLLSGIVEHSPSDRAGLMIGDLIVGLSREGRGLDEDLAEGLLATPVGRPAWLAIIRGGELRSVRVVPEG